MSDRGPDGRDPDPTEVFPPLPADLPTPPTGLPPIGADRDPEPTRVMEPPTHSDVPTTAMPTTGGPYDPGPPYGGGGGGGGGGEGGDEPFGEPEPWYRQPGPLAALIAGVAALVVALIALLVWAGGGDDDSSDDTLPTLASTSTTTPTTEPPPTTEATTTTESTTTTSTTTTTTSTTTTSTTTTLPPTTTTAPTTTEATTTTPAPTTVPAPTAWAVISGDGDLSQFAAAIDGSGLVDLFESTDEDFTVLAPTNAAFGTLQGDFLVEDYLIPGALSAAELFQLDEVETVSDQRLPVDAAAQTVGGAVVSARRDIAAANGTIQVVNGLITRPDGDD
jgi:uncharacterized surface protein with fasciclin (FAS1) repeats